MRACLAALFLLLPTAVSAQPTLPSCATPPFGDVGITHPYCEWIQQLKADQITSPDGCGGGNYCPENPVTRQMLAMMLEKAVRGTDTFQLQRRYAKVATVALLGTGDYASPNLAIADLASWCGTPGVNNRCLLRVQPGIYTLSTPLVLQDYVDLEGAGMEMTRLEFAGGEDANAPAVLAEGEGSVHDLEIRAFGGDYALALFMKESSSRSIRRVRALAQFAAVSNIAVRVTNGAAPVIDDSELLAAGSPTSTAVDVSGGTFSSFADIRRSSIRAAGTSAACVGVAVQGAVGTTHFVDLDDTEILVVQCGSGIGVNAGTQTSVKARGGSIIAILSTTENAGLKTAAIAGAHLLQGVEVSASGTGGTAVVVGGGGSGYVEIRDSKLIGSGAALSSTGGAPTDTTRSSRAL